VKKPRLIPTIIIGAALCVAAVFFIAYRELTQVEFGEDAPTVSWLPKTASHISYYRSYLRTAYEFDMAEQEFVAFAESRGWRLQRMEHEPFAIRRYSWCQHPVPPPNSLPPGTTDSQISTLESQLAAYQTNTTKRITNGYAYVVRQNNGGEITVGYDASLKRAYVFTTPR
jgi:hypothetical protein